MTIKWTKEKDDSLADGWGGNVSYTAQAHDHEWYVPMKDVSPVWSLYMDGAHVADYPTLRECKAHVASWAEAAR